MATYQLPPEPSVDVLWTTSVTSGPDEPVVTERWTRTPHGWQGADGGRPATWAELLNLGHVIHDQHPDLAGCQPLPWKLNSYGEVADATGRTVEIVECEENGLLITRAVNAYTEQLAAGGGA